MGLEREVIVFFVVLISIANKGIIKGAYACLFLFHMSDCYKNKENKQTLAPSN